MQIQTRNLFTNEQGIQPRLTDCVVFTERLKPWDNEAGRHCGSLEEWKARNKK